MSPIQTALATGVMVAGLAVVAPAAQAQSMTPMRGTIRSFSDEFALKVFPRNTYAHSIVFDVRAYDQDFRPIEAAIWPDHFTVAAGGVRAVTVVIPFAGNAGRKVRVCAESVPFPDQPSIIKAQICGKFVAQHLQ